MNITGVRSAIIFLTSRKLSMINKEEDSMCTEKSNIPEFEWICPCCGGKDYDANSLCLDCGRKMISREVTKNEQTTD